MGKDFKEKFEKVCEVKDRLINIVDNEISKDISAVDAKELGEVVDAAKDMAEIMEKCAKAEYYYSITEAMGKNSDSENQGYMEKYLPEIAYARSYTPYYREYPIYNRYYGDGNSSGARGSSNGNSSTVRNYSSEYPKMRYIPYDMNEDHSRYDGESWKYRRNYMEDMKSGDKDESKKSLDEYVKYLTDDIMEMIENMDTDEKLKLRQKIATLASKIS